MNHTILQREWRGRERRRSTDSGAGAGSRVGRLACSAVAAALIVTFAAHGADAPPGPEIVPSENRIAAFIASESARLKQELDDYGGWQQWAEAMQWYMDRVGTRIAKAKEDGSSLVYGEDGSVFILRNATGWWSAVESIRGAGGMIAASWSSLTTIARLDRDLRERGIRLVIVPVPARFEVYPEMFEIDPPRSVPTTLVRHLFMTQLLGQDILTLDLYPAMVREKDVSHEKLYMHVDNHWSAKGMAVGAREIADRFEDLGLMEGIEREAFATVPTTFTFPPSMLIKYAGKQSAGRPFKPIRNEGFRVMDPEGRSYDHANYEASSILLMGDSYMMGYRGPGGMFSSYLSEALSVPVSGLYTPGFHLSGPRPLARKGRAYIDRRKVIIWYMTARAITRDWPPAKLP